MKGYKQVIAERYDGRETTAPTGSSRYGLLAPTGWYLHQRTRDTMIEAARHMQKAGLDWRSATVLDLGCGGGATLRFLLELTGDPSHLAGTELSTHRMAQARALHPGIAVHAADLLALPFDDRRWDVAMAWTVLMHLPSREELDQALAGIARSLQPGGWFLWYDTVTADHFETGAADESAGFSLDQMRELAAAADLRLQFVVPALRFVLYRWHSGYLPERGWSPWLVRAAEAMLPGRPASVLCVFRKALQGG